MNYKELIGTAAMTGKMKIETLLFPLVGEVSVVLLY